MCTHIHIDKEADRYKRQRDSLTHSLPPLYPLLKPRVEGESCEIPSQGNPLPPSPQDGRHDLLPVHQPQRDFAQSGAGVDAGDQRLLHERVRGFLYLPARARHRHPTRPRNHAVQYVLVLSPVCLHVAKIYSKMFDSHDVLCATSCSQIKSRTGFRKRLYHTHTRIVDGSAKGVKQCAITTHFHVFFPRRSEVRLGRARAAHRVPFERPIPIHVSPRRERRHCSVLRTADVRVLQLPLRLRVQRQLPRLLRFRPSA